MTRKLIDRRYADEYTFEYRLALPRFSQFAISLAVFRSQLHHSLKEVCLHTLETSRGLGVASVRDFGVTQTQISHWTPATVLRGLVLLGRYGQQPAASMLHTPALTADTLSTPSRPTRWLFWTRCYNGTLAAACTCCMYLPNPPQG